MPKTLDAALVAHLDAIERDALRLVDGFDAIALAERNGRVQSVSLLLDRTAQEIGWHMRIVEQVSATQLGQQPATAQHHGQGRHFDSCEQWLYGVRKYRSFKRDVTGQWQQHGGGSVTKPYCRSGCHDPKTLEVIQPSRRLPPR